MTTIPTLDYLVDYYDLEPSLFRESDNLHKLFQSIFYVCHIQQIDLLWFAENILNIDAAENAHLDFIGSIVGQPRFLTDFNTEPYFGYEGSYQSKTFGSSLDPKVGGYWNSRSYFNTASSRQLNDDEYRRLIKARVIYNQSNCTANDLLEVINLLSNSKNNTVQMLNHGLIQINTDDSSGIISYFVDRLLNEDNILPIAAGVRVGLEQSASDGSEGDGSEGDGSEGDGETVEPPWSPDLVLPLKLKAETDSYGELTVVINFEGGSAKVDFGDGSDVLEYIDSVEHTYPASPVEDEIVTYSIILTPTSRIPLLSTDIRELTDWGSAGSVKRFRFSNMSPSVPASLPSWIKDTSYMFYGCRGFSSDVSGWDVSNVTNMEYMFFQCSSLNSDLGGWDVSKVTNMKYTFSECHGNLGTFENWDVSSVTDMSHMFDSAVAATYLNLSQWDVSNVTDMSYFLAAIEASNNFNSDLSKWNTSNVTNMSHMFYRCYSLFDKNTSVGNWSLEKWDVSKVTDMEGMFNQCYNGVSSNISKWKTGNVTNMKEMFAGCQNMNHLTFWDTSKVTTMEGMFEGAFQFNSDISNWDVSNVVNMTRMFKGVQWLIVSLDKWCVENIREEPIGFAPDADYMPEENKPVWGTCPSGDG